MFSAPSPSDQTFVLRMQLTTSTSFVCTPSKGSPPATLATCCWGKRPLIIRTSTHTKCKNLFKAIGKHKDEDEARALSLQTTVRTSFKDLRSSHSSPVYPNNLFVTLPLLPSLPARTCASVTQSSLWIRWMVSAPKGPLLMVSRAAGTTERLHLARTVKKNVCHTSALLQGDGWGPGTRLLRCEYTEPGGGFTETLWGEKQE